MKRILFSFLTLAMLTPMLVCGMDMGMSEAQAKSPHNCDIPCSEMDDLMFILDCMDVELQAAQNSVTVKQPDLTTSKIVYASVDATSSSTLFFGANNIRGSPPDKTVISSATPSVILNTQRFLI